MSSVDLISQSYEAFARGDMAGVLAHMHDEIEWHQAQGLPHGGVYHGIDEVRRSVFDPLARDWWVEFVVTPEQYLDAGADVVVLGRYRGVARGTGKKLDVPFVHIWTFQEGLTVRFRQFLDTAGWVEALASGPDAERARTRQAH
ncbi:MAG TPA: nuclear transport factor 2 family protein [Gaiellaceae bacterium]|nr:nuclear transport factor 2 family protein [Gaiellaceae bacterium]